MSDCMTDLRGALTNLANFLENNDGNPGHIRVVRDAAIEIEELNGAVSRIGHLTALAMRNRCVGVIKGWQGVLTPKTVGLIVDDLNAISVETKESGE